MKTYWKLICGCAALMLIVPALGFSWTWGACGVVACLLSGVAGAKLVPRVPVLRERLVWLAVSTIILGGVLQGAGLFCQLNLLWAVGLTMTLAIPLAGLACDTQQDEATYRELLRQ